MLEVFCDKFYGWGYMEFSKLDQHIKQTLKKTLIAKKIYIAKLGSYVK